MDVETATAKPRSPVSASIQIRDHTVIQDKPAEFGGTDEGVMASELLMAALLSCQLSTFAKVKAKRDAAAELDSLRCDCHFNDAGDIERLAVTWAFASGQSKEIETLIKLTDRVCTISRALKVPVESTYTN